MELTWVIQPQTQEQTIGAIGNNNGIIHAVHV